MAKVQAKSSMRDIANAAGVSVASVSRILSGDTARFAKATIKRVEAEARRLNYRPNALARSLFTGITKMAGVMVPGGAFYSLVVAGINETLLAEGHIMLHAWNPNVVTNADDPTEARIIHEMVERAVDGIILRPSSEEFERSYFEEIWQRGIPLIGVDREWTSFKTDFVGTDDYGVGRAAAEYLIGLGHQQLLFLGIPGCSTSRLRGQGFRDVISETPNAACRTGIVDAVDRDGAQRQIAAILQAETPLPTAVFCYSDPTVEFLLPVLHDLGLRVPADISIAGCGNTPLPPDVTTFDQQPVEVGRAAARLHLRRVREKSETPAPPETIRLPAVFIERGSTAPPP